MDHPCTRVLRGAGTALALALAALAPACGDAERQPNVVLISLDTLRADHLSCYGYERTTSPAIDALAREGVLFENLYANSNHTKISHMTIFTGLLPGVHKMEAESTHALSAGIPTLAERFRDSGYRTAAFADGGYVVPAYGFDRGFERFDSRFERVEDKLERVEAWLADQDAVPDERPTFLFFHTYGVHSPFLPDQRHDVFTDPNYGGALRKRVRQLRKKLRDHQELIGLAAAMRDFWKGRARFDEEDVRYLEDLYDGCIGQVDAAVARLLAALDEHGLLENTWVIVTADHGEAFREHGTFGHRQLHVEEMHVPLVIRPPGGLAQPRRVAEVAGLVDLTPTLMDIAGLEPSIPLQGRSLLAAVFDGPHPVHATGWEGDHAVMAHDYKLIVDRKGTFELFDRLRDPLERTDLLADGDAPEPPQLETLRSLFERVLVSCEELRATLGDPERASDLTAEEVDALRALGYVE